MQFLSDVGAIWLQSLVWLAGLALVFLVLTKFSPCNPGQNWWKDPRAAITDLVYWLILPLLTQFGRLGLLVIGVLLLYGQNPPETWLVRSWQIWVQIVAILLIQDVIFYGIHRFFHTRVAWRFHAIHHSSEVLDWTTTQRFHPVNAIAEFAVADVVILLMGFDPQAMVILGPINLAYSVMVHANLNWTFGPLRYVFASPVFHRWHHTSADEGLDQNFASTFPILDLIFGTYYMPAGVRPERYGVRDEAVPAGFIGQTLYPFQNTIAWAGRHPAPAIVAGLVLLVGGVIGVDWLNRPIQVAAPGTEPPAEQIPANIAAAVASLNRRPATVVAISLPTNQLFSGGTDGNIYVRDLTTNQEVAWKVHTRRINCLTVSPDGKLLTSASGDGSALVWEIATAKVLTNLRHDSTVISVAISNDGWIATGSVDGIARVWDPKGNLIEKQTIGQGAIHAISISEGGRMVAAAEFQNVITWSRQTPGVRNLEGLKDMSYTLSLTPDGSRLVTAGYDGRLCYWSTATGKLQRELSGHEGPIYSLAMAQDGHFLVSGGADKITRVWDLQSGQLAMKATGQSDLIFAVAMDVNAQRLLATGKEGRTQEWKLPTESTSVPVISAPSFP